MAVVKYLFVALIIFLYTLTCLYSYKFLEVG